MAQGATEYEIMVILHPEVAGEQVEARMARLRSALTDHGNDVTEVIDWGRRPLAYPIKQSFEGHYLIAHFEGGPQSRHRDLEQALEIDEQVLRHMIVKRND